MTSRSLTACGGGRGGCYLGWERPGKGLSRPARPGRPPGAREVAQGLQPGGRGCVQSRGLGKGVRRPRNLTLRGGRRGCWRGGCVQVGREARQSGTGVWRKPPGRDWGEVVGTSGASGWEERAHESLSPCPRCLARAAGAACLDWGSWAAPRPGWDCCWAPPRALDSCVPFTASGGNGASAMATTRASLIPWTTRRPQSQDVR